MNPIERDDGTIELRVYGRAGSGPTIETLSWPNMEEFVIDMENGLYDWFHHGVEPDATLKSFMYHAAKEKIQGLVGG